MRPKDFELDAKNYPFTMEIPTRFGDIDTLRHVNNVAIAQLFEEARVRFGIFSRNMPFNDMHSLGRLVTVSTLINYLGEVFYPDPVTVAVGVGHIGTSSYTLGCLMLQYDKPAAHSKTILVRSDNGKSTPLSKEVLEILTRYMIRQK